MHKAHKLSFKFSTTAERQSLRRAVRGNKGITMFQIPSAVPGSGTGKGHRTLGKGQESKSWISVQVRHHLSFHLYKERPFSLIARLFQGQFYTQTALLLLLPSLFCFGKSTVSTCSFSVLPQHQAFRLLWKITHPPKSRISWRLSFGSPLLKPAVICCPLFRHRGVFESSISDSAYLPS